jgi:DNA-binding LacI/PurR family transcriptional regulator
VTVSSIHDVAKYCGVSTATVSRALRGLPNVSRQTRELVQAAAAELGYVPSPSASGLSGGRHRAVAIVIPSTARWFYSKVIEGVDSVLRREGYDTFLIILAASMTDRERLFHNALLRKRADAVIALGIDFDDEERRELRSLEMPAMIVGGAVRGVRSVGVDDGAVGRAATEHLLRLGHARIGHIGGATEYGMQHSVGEDREHGWRSSLEAHGITPDPALHAFGGFEVPHAKVAALAMLHQPDRPTAIFAGSDEMAFGVLLAAGELGLRVPEDLSVIGVDDHDWSGAFGLTTMRQDPYEQGRFAARTVLDLLNDVPVSVRTSRAPFSLVLRASTSAPGESAPPTTATPTTSITTTPSTV